MKTSVVVFLIFFFILTCTSSVVKENSGPYKTTLVRTEKCKTPLMPYAKNPAYEYFCESYNSRGKMLLRANLTVLRVNPALKIIVRKYIKEGDKWKIMYKNKSDGCHGPTLEALKLVFNVQSSDRCIPKGTYTLKDLDFNNIQHKWLNKFMYGKFLFTMHMLTGAGTNVCWEYETEISPIPE